MKRILTQVETLVYCDGPQLFLAHDQLQLRYLCVLIQRDDDFDRYFCIPISLRRLNDFLSGESDLRTIFKVPETDELFTGKALDGQYEHIEIQPVPLDQIDSDWLPEPGFLLEREHLPDIKVVQQSVERQRAVIHWSLNPPEAREESKITAEHLGQALKLVQRLVKHAFRKALRDVNDQTKRMIDTSQNYEMEVFAFSPGSFTIQMQTTAPADLLGYSQIAKALRLIDDVNQELDNPEATVETISKIGGHFATTYRDLLKFIIENSVPIGYEWSMPELRDSVSRTITARNANPIYNILIQREDIGREEKKLIGRVSKVDVNNGTWRLLSEDDQREHAGKCDPATEVSLAGITVKTQRYEFVCEERLEEERGTGRESTVLYLKSHKPLS